MDEPSRQPEFPCHRLLEPAKCCNYRANPCRSRGTCRQAIRLVDFWGSSTPELPRLHQRAPSKLLRPDQELHGSATAARQSATGAHQRATAKVFSLHVGQSTPTCHRLTSLGSRRWTDRSS